MNKQKGKKDFSSLIYYNIVMCKMQLYSKYDVQKYLNK